MFRTLSSLALGALIVAATTSVGCSNGICSRPVTEDPVVFRGGEVIGDTYRTSDFDGDLLYFPGGGFYEIHHRLGERPVSFAAYLSFERDGIKSGSVAPAAGNQVELKAMDETSITLLNGSCSDYFLLVQAFASGTGGAGGEGSEGAAGAGGT